MKNTYAYQAFLIRLWQEAEHSPWRASLEDPHTGERRSFASIEGLLAYLQAQTSSTGRTASTDSTSQPD